MAQRLLRKSQPFAWHWQQSDFPMVCESCLGDNPYIRFQRGNFDKECKICSRPFTNFRWRPGRNARYKNTQVCQTCSKLQNTCQVCILNIDSGLPVQVHRTALGDASNYAIPKSDVNREFFAEEHDRIARLCIEDESSYGKSRPCDTLLKLQRKGPYYNRNRANVCSFFVRGECTRGAECPYRHEMPITGDLSKQNIKDRYYGVNDPVAMKLLSKAAEMTSLEPTDDESIKTLYVGGIDPRISEQHLRDHFYAHGEIESIKMVLQKAEKTPEELPNKHVRLDFPIICKSCLRDNPYVRMQRAHVYKECKICSGPFMVFMYRPGGDAQYKKTEVCQTCSKLQNKCQFCILNLDSGLPVQVHRTALTSDETLYPSMDPLRIGALVPSQYGAPSGPAGSGKNNSSSERQHHVFQTMHLPSQGQYYQQFYPPPPPPYQQHTVGTKYHAAVTPQPPSLPINQEYQHSAPPGSSKNNSGSTSGEI